MLRDYQQRGIDMLYDWFRDHDTGNPCLVYPTGAGKSHVIAALVRDALTNWPETRVLMLTHVKELIEQNAQKMREHWPDAPLGIYSASIGERRLCQPVTFAGIQSIHRRAAELGHVDLCLIDEAHLIGHADSGMYRRFLADLCEINPALRVIGLTATPYRLGHGMIHEGEGVIFSHLIEPVTIEELVHRGFLSPLRSKQTAAELDVSGVAKRGGEYVAGALEAAVDDEALTRAIVAETIERAHNRRSWLVFCAGVSHAENVARELAAQGISAACITGKTPKAEREELIAEYRAGRLRALTNANVLTTGFDAPDTDCLVMLRPTMSPGLYVQMAGRGMRLKSHARDCLVLDYAGNVRMHGPITCVEPPSRAAKREGAGPTKSCPECSEIVNAAARTCPACGHAWPPPEEKLKSLALHDDDIMGNGDRTMRVTGWQWRVHIAQSGKRTLRVSYYGSGLTDAVDEYLCVMHEGYAGDRARAQLVHIARQAGTTITGDISTTAEVMTAATPPREIGYKKTGRYFEVTRRTWSV